ncbi:carboxypeptidase regulatory-like domain-containing protein [Occallatibacter riparius]|uniref:Carboxypeptidase regulatory-like domain-containing protein n=1 Tax=Occallatibacter riparius TaxID=1002689 RepID=A0A9J7BVF7_9BACT|nr:carboxypeptidase regulatory-like domain-containing protein [Occallatibacter riparius]UWZ86860.1 carboxypeptidase regulatory-like domain-containing protein [Occallatibacter riparius]
MYRLLAVVCLCASIAASAESPAFVRTSPRELAPPQVVKDLPVRKVVLYKNGVGYFEHSGSVTGNQRVFIDFTSPQLNDVLQSLTVLDEGGGRIAGVNYNSTTPLAEQLKTLALGMTDDPTSTELFQALRGQRVEVTGASGGPIIGRLMSIESRTEKKGDDDTTVEKFFLTVVAASGAVRVIELTPTLSVRPLDANLQGQLDRYLELLSTARSTGLRHLTLNALGQGQRQLRVSYISEVPVWKSTYRIVFPHTGANTDAIVQGWAVVDNTVGADWDNVQLSLVAGSPQSFIQPLSQPLYMRRQQVAIATGVETSPQTHEAAIGFGQAGISGTVTDQSGAVIANAAVTITALGGNTVAKARTSADGSFSVSSLPPGTYNVNVMAPGFQQYLQNKVRVGNAMAANVNATLQVGSETQTVTVEAEAPPPMPMAAPASAIGGLAMNGRNMASLGGIGTGTGYVGGVYRASDAMNEGDVATNAFDDFFQYSLTQPVTIHKNESAMVPILQQDLPAEHVTLWNPRQRSPLRAVWLENKSKLTLDAGSFSIFESGEFAGQGLLDPIHPGEKRLLSYANDQAVRVGISDRANYRVIHHLSIRKGSIVETWIEVQGATYTANNDGDEERVVLIEHPRHAGADGWKLDGNLKAAETTPTLYRLRLVVPAHSSAKLEVHERGPQYTIANLHQQPEQRDFVLELIKQVPDAKEQLQPVLDAQDALAEINEKIADAKKAEETAAADEARYRENVTALKGNDVAKRFVDELNHAEDQLQATRKLIASLEIQRAAATDKLDKVISALSYDWNEGTTK